MNQRKIRKQPKLKKRDFTRIIFEGRIFKVIDLEINLERPLPIPFAGNFEDTAISFSLIEKEDIEYFFERQNSMNSETLHIPDIEKFYSECFLISVAPVKKPVRDGIYRVKMLQRKKI